MNQINWMAISMNIVIVDIRIDETNSCSLDDAQTINKIINRLTFYKNNIKMTFFVPAPPSKISLAIYSYTLHEAKQI
jgi:hypothetical protein